MIGPTPRRGMRPARRLCRRNKKNRKRRNIEFVTAVDRAGKQKIGRADTGKNSGNFEKKMEGSCPNHDFPIKHLFKDCELLKRYLKGRLTSAPKGNRGEPREASREEDAFSRPEGYLMIFGWPAAYESRRQHKLAA
jgi:hypothetical protein